MYSKVTWALRSSGNFGSPIRISFFSRVINFCRIFELIGGALGKGEGVKE